MHRCCCSPMLLLLASCCICVTFSSSSGHLLQILYSTAQASRKKHPLSRRQPSGWTAGLQAQAIGHVGSLKLRACWYSPTTSHPPKSDRCNFSCGLAGTWSLCQRKGRTGTASQPPHHRSSGDSRALLGPLLLSRTSPAGTRRGRLAGSCVSRT
jgi:hypothetical protein